MCLCNHLFWWKLLKQTSASCFTCNIQSAFHRDECTEWLTCCRIRCQSPQTWFEPSISEWYKSFYDKHERVVYSTRTLHPLFGKVLFKPLTNMTYIMRSSILRQISPDLVHWTKTQLSTTWLSRKWALPVEVAKKDLVTTVRFLLNRELLFFFFWNVGVQKALTSLWLW